MSQVIRVGDYVASVRCVALAFRYDPYLVELLKSFNADYDLRDLCGGQVTGWDSDRHVWWARREVWSAIKEILGEHGYTLNDKSSDATRQYRESGDFEPDYDFETPKRKKKEDDYAFGDELKEVLLKLRKAEQDRDRVATQLQMATEQLDNMHQQLNRVIYDNNTLRQERASRGQSKGTTASKTGVLTLAGAYATLGLEPYCTREQLETAFKAKMKRVHPDRVNGMSDALVQLATELATRVNQSRELIQKSRGW